MNKFVLSWLVLIGVFITLVFFLRRDTQSLPSLTPRYVEQAQKVGLSSDKLWSIIQHWRTENELEPYIKDNRLCEIAKERAPEIANEIGTPHAGFLKRYSNSPYSLSENGTGAESEQNALDRWLSSPPHKAALFHDWRYSCVACYESNCVQIFSNFTPG